MPNDANNRQDSSALARLVGDTDVADLGPALWQRLDLEGVARRLIQTARMAAAEHTMMRLHQAIIRRVEARLAERTTSDSQPGQPNEGRPIARRQSA